MNSSSLLLPPLSALYGVAVRTRLAAYRRGWLSAAKLEVPVISVGNITVGGTGKTPLVEFICRTLAQDGRKVCVLTRGYGKSNPDKRVVVSDGQSLHADAQEAGDEALLLAQNLKGEAAVVSDPNRLAAGIWARSEFGTDVFVLDDGFQHLQLVRDLNVVTIDATDPWGGTSLLPYGKLREPLSGLARADCAVITRTEMADYSTTIAEIRQLIPGKPVFTSRMQVTGIHPLTREIDVTTSLPQPAAAFCGVGNPTSFFHLLQQSAIELTMTQAFADHHSYTQGELDGLNERAKAAGAKSLITTRKDEVKLQQLQFEIPCYVLDIKIAIDESARFVSIIRAALRTK